MSAGSLGGRSRLDEQLERMTADFLSMQDTLAGQLRALQAAFAQGDTSVREEVERLDRDIGAANARIEGEALHLLARQSPVAHDLKLTLLILQSTPDLERAGDYAKHVARRLSALRAGTAGHPSEFAQALALLLQMATTLRAASSPMNAALAHEVRALDDQVDALYDRAVEQVLAGRPDAALADTLEASHAWRAAERLGDHLVNVAQRTERLLARPAPSDAPA
ncbi:phosphate signaling complex protein PhoU [Deinococcus radiodurans]|jgi:phosphate transport system regulatory protein PhoU|uniref:phosphate signaling complex protein PhoU n=1 Tax=Deinococcus radiodurans TaxID=1299 RepID=UPI0004878A15|nr:phosphate signaling complex protein PhoU [Deinococcus radiodurans]ANC73015.1 phosphate transport system regulatory protein PhoU [Deinococcus radiodurans R1 = ATCC 13939 = DSM 20539]QEM72970.1 phosphate transport system regulatory protein PhoU [Deinococcus radiodurans]QIP30345.1 phosphate signaling complex protein PhoU [Deinococcus radiodurans]QIP33297.1 phosphate signaling complex protein PhoU [Deinococcus radiodurans]UDL01934.1 phosphate signaling complex protein PhoU [Deinococcus radiodur